MLRIAQVNCPEAQLAFGDMLAITLPKRYEGIIAWNSLFHIPRSLHSALFLRMRNWLMPGGSLLLSVGGSDDEFTATLFDVPFFYSAHRPDVSIALLRDIGFEILLSEIDDPSSRGHMAILCRKSMSSAY